MYTYCITPLAKGLCDTPLVILTLKCHDLHPFLTPTPSVYAHIILNCVESEECREESELEEDASVKRYCLKMLRKMME